LVGSVSSEYAHHTVPSPLGSVAAWLAAVLWIPPFLATVAAIPLLYPDGRLPSPRWRWPARIALGAGGLAVLLFGTTQFAVDDAGFPQVHNPLDLPIDDDAQLAIVVACFLVVLVIGVAARSRWSCGCVRRTPSVAARRPGSSPRSC
jgi:hypothetical protein